MENNKSDLTKSIVDKLEDKSNKIKIGIDNAVLYTIKHNYDNYAIGAYAIGMGTEIIPLNVLTGSILVMGVMYGFGKSFYLILNDLNKNKPKKE